MPTCSKSVATAPWRGHKGLHLLGARDKGENIMQVTNSYVTSEINGMTVKIVTPKVTVTKAKAKKESRLWKLEEPEMPYYLKESLDFLTADVAAIKTKEEVAFEWESLGVFL